MKISVIVASKGRPTELGELAYFLSRQTLYPHAVFFSVTDNRDLPPLAQLSTSITLLYGPPGSAHQRNRALESIPVDTDVVVFIDDDYVPTCTMIEDIVAFFTLHPDVVGIEGQVIQDGIKTAGISRDEAFKIVVAFENTETRPALQVSQCIASSCAGLYGCNMAFRFPTIRDIRFDEHLPLYAWQEDSDFSFQAGQRGPLWKTNAFFGVHRGVKNGRSPGQLVGYSQIANPIYLHRKGTLTKQVLRPLIWRRLVANHIRAIFPEPWVDRRGRVLGNWLALKDWLSGRLDPMRILDL